MRLPLKATLLALGMLAQAAFAQTKPVAIVGATVAGQGAKATVLMRDGKIEAVGENVSVPADAEVIQGAGLFVYPGFIDAYTTRGVKLPEAPAAGTPPDIRNTAPASMWHANRKGIRVDVLASKCLDLKDQLASNYGQGITTALVAPGTGSVRGIATVVNYTEAGDVLMPSAAGEFSFRGGGFGGGGGGADSGYPGSLLGQIALLRQVLADAQTYATSQPATKDEGLENLKPLFIEKVPGVFVADTDREITRALRIADEFGIKPIIGSGREAYKQAETLKLKKIPVFVTLDLGVEPSLKSEGADATPQAVLDERHVQWLERASNAKRLSDAGVTIAFSTVGSNLDDYLKNVRKLITAGLPKDAALAAMTINPATALGVADRVGVIAPGKQANIVIMTGDFVDEKSTVQAVFVGGMKIETKKEAGK